MQSDVLPDFGYSQDNYLIDRSNSNNKWKVLLGLIGDQNRFEYLMQFITLAKLKKEIKEKKLNEMKDRAARHQQLLEQQILL